jgi:protein phosphatase 4 regulatory subunit 3
MTKHEVIIQSLAKSPLGGPRFSLFIRRWEMNSEPLPPTDDKSNRYRSISYLLLHVIKYDRRPAETRFVPGHSRHLEAEEEDYFNADDDDDFVPPISSQWIRGQSPTLTPNTLKRKRRPAVESISKNFRPPSPAPSRTPPLGSLVDYDDDDESITVADEPVSALRSSPSGTQQNPQRSPLQPSTSILTSSKLPSRQLGPNKSAPPRPSPNSNDVDEDDFVLLWSASKQPPSPSSSPSLPTGSGAMSKLVFGHMRSSEKRRREDDDDGGLLERLNKVKRPDIGSQKDSSIPANRTTAVAATKPGDNNPPRRFKLKLGGASLGVASVPSTSAPSPSPNNSKNGGTG